MKQARLQDSYQVLHIIFAAIIVAVMAYSAVFSPSGGDHAIPSQYRLLTGESTASTGMSRAFSSIVRLDFTKALSYNPYSLSVFAFFFVQLWMRVLFFVLYARRGDKRLVAADVALSVVLFLWCFKDLMAAMYA